MVMNWGIRPADLIDGDDNRRQFGDEHEPARITPERPTSTPTRPTDGGTGGGSGQPLP